MLSLLSSIYNKFVKIRNDRFDRAYYPISKLSCKVISVGNIIAGGTGKTPFTIMLGKLLMEKGVKIGVVGGGYGRRNKGLCVVCDGEKITSDIYSAGDELYLIAQKLMVPCVVAEKKVDAAKYLCEKFNVDVIIVDDAFQHRYLHRDLDIVLINKDTIDNPHTFPKGFLREPLENIRRADLICYEENISNNKIFNEIENISYKKQNIQLKEYFNNEIKTLNKVDNPVVLTCSIAKPKDFEASIKGQKIEVVESVFHKDHFDYQQEDVTKIVYICKLKNAKSIITTEKDFVKLIKYQDLIFRNGISIITSEIEVKINDKEKLTNLINIKCHLNI